jgi:hypothetical protein
VEGVSQAHALGYLLLPGFAAKRLNMLNATAKRFEFSFGLRLIDVLYPLFFNGTGEPANSDRSWEFPASRTIAFEML